MSFVANISSYNSIISASSPMSELITFSLIFSSWIKGLIVLEIFLFVLFSNLIGITVVNLLGCGDDTKQWISRSKQLLSDTKISLLQGNFEVIFPIILI